jgi:glutamate 5-kinase
VRDFSGVKRVVVKLGTNVLTSGDTLDRTFVFDIARQVAELREGGREVCLVSSGAIGLGARELGITGRVQDVVLRQACAAVGQPLLMEVYRDAFAAQGITAAQVLITREALDGRSSYVRLRNAVERLLELGAVPVFNENDSVATAEIGTAFGDNDQLSALVASKVDAGLLILLSDVDGYYDRDPRDDSAAKLLDAVDSVTEEMVAAAGKPGSVLGTGGMATKLKAVRIAADGGCRVVLAHGRTGDVVPRILAGEQVGSLFIPRRTLKNRSRWLLHSAPRAGLPLTPGRWRQSGATTVSSRRESSVSKAPSPRAMSFWSTIRRS